MSEAAVRELTAAVERLIIATDRLSNLISNHSVPPSSVSASSAVAVVPAPVEDPVVDSGFVIVLDELSRVPYPEHFQEQLIRNTHVGLENGPSPVPSFVYTKLRNSLSNKPPGTQARADSAFKAGHWARVAIDTETEYQGDCFRPPSETLDLPTQHI